MIRKKTIILLLIALATVSLAERLFQVHNLQAGKEEDKESKGTKEKKKVKKEKGDEPKEKKHKKEKGGEPKDVKNEQKADVTESGEDEQQADDSVTGEIESEQ